MIIGAGCGIDPHSEGVWMAGQSIERREVLQLLAFASAAAGFAGFRKWAYACDHVLPARHPEAASDPYQPLYFSSDEYATLERLAELIIPGDDTPGAREAGVSEFIDFMVANDPAMQMPFRFGLAWIESRARFLFDKRFRELNSQQQTAMLEQLAYRDRYQSGDEDGRAFFGLMRDMTVKGYYTSRIGLEQLGYPGLKTTWDEIPGCPHVDDREHRHLA
jgi:gluconate 2-dehydrogenase gamma chain